METKTQPRFNYTQNAWEGKKYRQNQNLYGASLTKAIRQEIKEAFPNCKFSVVSETYSGGQSVNIYLMSADFNPFNELNDEVKEKIEWNTRRAFGDFWEQRLQDAIESYKRETTIDYNHEINQYYINDDICLTDKTKEVMTKALGIAQSYNFDDSDAQVDYFHTNFYLHAGIGKWNKPFIIKK